MWQFISWFYLIKVCPNGKSKYTITSYWLEITQILLLLFFTHIWKDKRGTDWQEHNRIYTLTKWRVRLPKCFLWRVAIIQMFWGFSFWSLPPESVLHFTFKIIDDKSPSAEGRSPFYEAAKSPLALIRGSIGKWLWNQEAVFLWTLEMVCNDNSSWLSPKNDLSS